MTPLEVVATLKRNLLCGNLDWTTVWDRLAITYVNEQQDSNGISSRCCFNMFVYIPTMAHNGYTHVLFAECCKLNRRLKNMGYAPAFKEGVCGY